MKTQEHNARRRISEHPAEANTAVRQILSFLLVLALAMIHPVSARATGFTRTGSMFYAIYDHTATLLPNGLVLVAGGGVFSEALTPNAEIFNPATGNWTLTNSMITPRMNHTATLLFNGKVLLAGGLDTNGNTISAAELFNPYTGTWAPTFPMNNARALHTATLLTNGEVLVAGGYGNSETDAALTNAELYNPITGRWTNTGSMTVGRWAHTSTLLPNGTVLVSGGADINSAETYNPASGTWTATEPMHAVRSFHTAVLLTNGMVLVAGGVNMFTSQVTNGAELYNPATETWSMTGSMTTNRFEHAATLLPNGNVLVTGGFAELSDVYTNAELYNPATGTWAGTGAMNIPRERHTATLLPDGNVLVVAGGDFFFPQTIYTASAELYGSTSNTVTSIGSISAAKMPTGFQINFTNCLGSAFAELIATNLAAPLTNWTATNAIIEIFPGQYQCLDNQTNKPQRFYRIGSP